MEIREFIAKAHERNIDNETIRRSLLRHGWSEAAIDAAILGDLEVPTSTEAPAAKSSPGKQSPSSGPLASALHHVLLWFFVGSAALAITSAISSLFYETVSEDALASFIAVSVITFIPFWIAFLAYLRQRRHEPRLVPGRIWSIITICIGSIGVMSAAIVGVVTLITDGQVATAVSAGALLVLFTCVVLVYATALSITTKKARIQKLLLHIPIMVIALLLVGIFVPSLLQLGPVRNDESLREDLIESVEAIRIATENENKLPDDASEYLANPAINYRKLSETRYELCAPFAITKTQERPRNSSIDDAYVSNYDFMGDKDNNCFTLQSSQLNSTRMNPIFPSR